MDKKQAWLEIALSHFEVEEGIQEIYVVDHVLNDGVIRILEINNQTIPTNEVEVFSFAGTDQMPFRQELVELHPSEVSILAKDNVLTNGWNLDTAIRYTKSEAAEELARIKDVTRK